MLTLNQDVVWFSFIPYGLYISKILIGEGLVNSKSLFLKILIFSEFLTFQPSLLQSIIEEEKKEFSYLEQGPCITPVIVKAALY